MSKGCTYSFKGQRGEDVTLKGMAAIQAFLANGGIQYLRDRGETKKSAKRPAVVDTPEFKRWSGGAQFVAAAGARSHKFRSGEPVVVEAFHGTTNASLEAFDRSRANIESDMGAGFYASSSPEDVARNYANNEGPDLTARIERMAETIEQDDEFEGDHEDAVAQARSQLSEGSPNTLKLFVRFSNPAVVGGPGETFLDYSESYDEEADEYGEPEGALVRLIDGLDDIGDGVDLNGSEIEELKQTLLEEAGGEGLKVGKVAGIFKEALAYTYDDTGTNNASNEMLRQALERAGFDGIIDTTVATKFKNMGIPPGTTHYIAFNPNQLKSATGNSGAFSEAPEITRSAARPQFFSQLERAITQVPARLGNMAAPQWAQWLKANAPKLGVKQDEITWSGIEDFLKMRGKDKLSKDEIAGFLSSNGVKVEETMMSSSGLTTAEQVERRELNDLHRRLMSGEDGVMDEAEIERLEELDAKADGGAPTKYHEYVVPGGENYRELLVTLPKSASARAEMPAGFTLIDVAEQDRQDGFPVPADEVGPWRFEGPDESSHTYKDRDEAIRDAWRSWRNSGGADPGGYKSNHWDQKNVLVHMRLDDRTDAAGAKVLFLNDLQSDWGQDGKKEGIQDRDPAAAARDVERKMQEASGLRAEAARLAAEGRARVKKFRAENPDAEQISDELLAVQRANSDKIHELSLRADALTEEARAAKERLGSKGAVPAAPFIGDTKSWVSLGLKRAIMEAVEGGYDKVAIVSGEQAAEMFDLSKQVDMLSMDPGYPDGYNITAWRDDSEVASRKVADESEAADMIGKEAAAKLFARKEEGHVELTGLDLKVGGEGMKAFYDQIVPQVLRDVAKKLGGKVETVMVPAKDMSSVDREINRARVERGDPPIKQKMSEQLGLTITDSMRDTVLSGVPPFSRKRATADVFDETTIEIAAAESKKLAGFLGSAIEEDVQGVIPGKPRTLDRWLAAGKISEDEIRSAFAKTIGHIRAKHGDELTLWRADAPDSRKTPDARTVYMSDEDVARKYADNDRTAKPYSVKIGELLGVYARPSGYYEAIVKIPDGGLREADVSPSRKRQTETPEFKAWFDGSHVVDNNGDPLLMYHGTSKDSDFSRFKVGARGAWFTSDPEDASDYASDNDSKGLKYNPATGGYDEVNSSGRVLPVYLSIKNPYTLTADDMLRVNNANYARAQAKLFAEVRAKGHDGIRWSNNLAEQWVVLGSPSQIKSALGNSGSFDPGNPDITKSAARDWQTPGESKFDNMVYTMQDKHVDTKRVVDAIREAKDGLAEDLDVYLQEELYHGRAAKRTEDFVAKELQPLIDEMAKSGLTVEDLDSFLHARHAKEANAVVAERNPDLPDGGSGMTNAEVDAYFAELSDTEREALEKAAAKVDGILHNTREMYVDYELESRETVDSWGAMFEHYVPLMREDDGSGGGMGTGQGFSIKGREVKSRTGSTRKVVDILANIAMQRERAIVRGEKNRVAQALVGLATSSPNRDFWMVDVNPLTPVFNPKTGLVEHRPDPMLKGRPNVVVAKVMHSDGSIGEHAVVFNETDKRAMRMAAALKNLDAAQMEGLLGASAKVTRYFAAINTQYNPVFGIVNGIRDIQGALINLKSTELASEQRKVVAGTIPAMRGIYADLRATRKGGSTDSAWAELWEDFQNVGGQTGYRDQFRTSEDRANAIKAALDPDAWMDSKLGKIFTANGALKVPLAAAMKGAKWLFDWLSDYNEAIENGVRLSVYKAGLDKGLSKEKSASIAKNISVNFNRKGQIAQQAGALFAFFNASAQGTARLASVIFDMEPGKPKTIRLSGLGKKIVYGGVMLGSMQALMLAAAGFGDDDPPEFARERSLIIPTGGKTYITIPMPLGLHVIPTVGRVATEWALGGFKNGPQKAVGLMSVFADSFNPIGNAGLSMQTLAPTVLDPLVALTENKDFTGRPIAKESRNPAIPGHALAKDTASTGAKLLSEAINYVTGGNEFKAGALSPTPDQIDYLIGQVTGGVGRELSKVEQSSLAVARGEELPTYKIPLVGRFIGSAASQASEGNQFFANTRDLNELETEAKGLKAAGRATEARELLASRPEAYLIAQANVAERAITKLRQEKSALIKSGAPREEVRAVEERITQRMASFNRAVEGLREKQGAN